MAPLVLALWGAAAAALRPAAPQAFTVATASPETYSTLTVQFKRLIDDGQTGAGETVAAGSDLSASEPFSSPSVAPTTAGEAVLAVRITPDTKTAKPGGKITYAVEVRNVGTAGASGVFAESHVPAGTAMSSRGDCLDGGVAKPVCSGVDPAEPDGSTEHISHSFGTIAPGRVAVWWFTVTVELSTPVGTRIKNHAHASATGVALMTTDDVVVTVN